MNDDDKKRDPYEDVAIVYAGFLCQKCSGWNSGNPTGDDDNADVPWAVMAQTARDAKWRVEPSNNDWLILCPTCAK